MRYKFLHYYYYYYYYYYGHAMVDLLCYDDGFAATCFYTGTHATAVPYDGENSHGTTKVLEYQTRSDQVVEALCVCVCMWEWVGRLPPNF